METECSVVNCGNKSSETKVFYKFPMSFDTCMQWVQNTGNQKLLQDFSLGGAQLFTEKHVCSDHFSDQDFAVFGEPNRGLRCHAVPLKNLKKELQVKDMPKPPVKKKYKGIKRSILDAVPVIQSIKEEPREIENTLSEDSITESSTNDAIPVFTSIKEEPDLDRLEQILPFPLVNPDDENFMSATYDAVLIEPSKGEPRVIESTLPLSQPFAAFNAEKNTESVDPLIITPKIEQVDIEEVLLTDNFTDDESMDVTTDGDDFQDLPAYYKDIKDPSLMNVSDVSCVNPQRAKLRWRKSDLSKKSKHARKQARARERETAQQKAVRLEKVRARASERRHSESEVETTLRRYKCAVRAAVKRSRETEEEKKVRQEKNKIRAAERRRNMTPEQRAEWRERNRIQTKERRERESELKKIVRRYNNAIRASMKRSSETPEQRMERRLKDALRAAERRKMETPEEREERLKKDRERITLRRLQLLMSETPEQREARLKRERERMYRKRHGIKEDSMSADTSNDATDSQQYSEDSIQNLSEILIMYPPSIEIEVPEDAESVVS